MFIQIQCFGIRPIPGYKDNLKKKFAWIKLAKQMNLKGILHVYIYT